MVGTWFGEFCSCCCLPLLPQLACSILPTIYRDFFGLCTEAVKDMAKDYEISLILAEGATLIYLGEGLVNGPNKTTFTES